MKSIDLSKYEYIPDINRSLTVVLELCKLAKDYDPRCPSDICGEI